MEEKAYVSIYKDTSSFKVIDAEETERTGDLTLKDIHGMILRDDEEKKQKYKAINDFNKNYREAKETIASLCSYAIVYLKYNVEDLKNPKADERKKKKSIKVIKGSEDELTDNKEFKEALNKLTNSIMEMK